MTEMLYGSRFLGADLADLADPAAGSRYFDDADACDNVVEYTPRHLRAAALSRELQEALDAAFAPAYEALAAFTPEPEPLPEPLPESMPLPEPVPVPVAEVVLERASEVEVETLFLVVPETLEYPSVPPQPVVVAPAIPEAIFREAVEASEVVVTETVVTELTPRVPAAAAPLHTPVSPTPFPERELVEARSSSKAAGREKKHSRHSRKIRPTKVDVSRLMVPPQPRLANG